MIPGLHGSGVSTELIRLHPTSVDTKKIPKSTEITRSHFVTDSGVATRSVGSEYGMNKGEDGRGESQGLEKEREPV